MASAEDAPFTRAGVPLGARVQAIDGEQVASARQLIRRLATYEPGSSVAVDYLAPDGKRERTRVRLQEQPTKLTGVSVPVLFTYRSSADDSEGGFVLLDLWIISLFRYKREGGERTYRILRFFSWSTGVGELSE